MKDEEFTKNLETILTMLYKVDQEANRIIEKERPYSDDDHKNNGYPIIDDKYKK